MWAKNVMSKESTPSKPKETTIRPVGTSPFKKHFKFFVFVLVEFMDGMNLSGRIGGNVYQKNGIKRNFANPGVFLTPAAGRSKGLFSLQQTLFAALSVTIQKAWNAYGFTYINRFAKVKALRGRSAFTRLNVNLTNSGQGTITTPPVSLLPADPLLRGIIIADSSVHSLKMGYVPNTNAGQVLVYATAPVRHSILKPTSRMLKLIGVFDGTAASPVTLTTEYDAVFGVNAVAGIGMSIFIQVVTISATGNASPFVGYSGIIS